MPDFRVRWEVDLTAETAVEAAKLALEMQRDPDSTATVFWVQAVEERGRYHVVLDGDPVEIVELHFFAQVAGWPS